jgi:hypothetical protein
VCPHSNAFCEPTTNSVGKMPDAKEIAKMGLTLDEAKTLGWRLDGDRARKLDGDVVLEGPNQPERLS